MPTRRKGQGQLTPPPSVVVQPPPAAVTTATATAGLPTSGYMMNIPDAFYEAIRQRAKQEGISQGELVSYALVRLWQLEELGAAGDERRMARAVREIARWASRQGAGSIARWVQQHLATLTRVKQIRPPTPEMWRDLPVSEYVNGIHPHEGD